MPILSDTQKLTIFAQSKIIAIIGLSPNPTKPSYKVAAYLQKQGYTIIPIYPRVNEILGQKTFCTLKEYIELSHTQHARIDIINIFRKNEALPQIAQEIIDLHIRPQCVWVQLGLHNSTAKDMLTRAKITYEENSCIKLEHQKLC